jgi:hypothetical protein
MGAAETVVTAYQPARARRSLVDARVGTWGRRTLAESQLREIVPEEQLQRLIAKGRAQPAALRDAGVAAAADPYTPSVETLRGWPAASPEGVLQPIEVVGRQGRYIRDGHRRSLAALLAGLTSPRRSR